MFITYFAGLIHSKDTDLKESVEKGTHLPIMEDFYTLQGEGEQSGRAAYFVRIAGCDVGCHWCDVKESWTTEGFPVKSVGEIVNRALSHPSKMVVITGGEPLMYPLDQLTEQLNQSGFETCIETSGAHPLSGNWHWICLSPKKFKAPLEEIYEKADELKIIIYNHSDFQWAEKHAAKVPPTCKLYLQVEWSKSNQLLPDVIAYTKENPKWRISLQTHKYMNIP